jgi:type IV pilus assembly protein PilE
MTAKPAHRAWSSHGFTLPELLLVMAILAIITGLALPAWRNHVITARRTDAMALLMEIAARQEQFRLAHRRYAMTADLGPAPPTGLGILNASGNYQLTASVGAAGATYQVIATVNGSGPQTDDQTCWLFGVDEAGRRWARSLAGNDTTKNCWRN